MGPDVAELQGHGPPRDDADQRPVHRRLLRHAAAAGEHPGRIDLLELPAGHHGLLGRHRPAASSASLLEDINRWLPPLFGEKCFLWYDEEQIPALEPRRARKSRTRINAADVHDARREARGDGNGSLRQEPAEIRAPPACSSTSNQIPVEIAGTVDPNLHPTLAGRGGASRRRMRARSRWRKPGNAEGGKQPTDDRRSNAMKMKHKQFTMARFQDGRRFPSLGR